MLRSRLSLAALLLVGFGGLSSHVSARAIGDLNPKAITITLPADIKWTKGPSSERATLYGDPSKPGYYVILVKWLPHNNSRPHFHPNDRYIQVLSGTWWVNTGAKYDPAGFKPVQITPTANGEKLFSVPKSGKKTIKTSTRLTLGISLGKVRPTNAPSHWWRGRS